LDKNTALHYDNEDMTIGAAERRNPGLDNLSLELFEYGRHLLKDKLSELSKC
jgi:hypothetical protein